eukprot:jgi/Ulvmu1/6595/UM003_0232.1
MLRRALQTTSSNTGFFQVLTCQMGLAALPMQRTAQTAAFASSAAEPKDGDATADSASEAKAEGAGSQSDDTLEDVSVAEVQGQLAERRARVEELEAELEAVRGRAVTVMADMENLRKRTSQQMEETRQFALQGFCKNILDVADNLERALDSVPGEVLEAAKDSGKLAAGAGAGEEAPEGDVSCEVVAKNLSSLHGGVAMSQKIMLKIFQENGLEQVPTEVGGEFDPNVHNAMFEVPSADVPPGRVAAIIKHGYALNGRVIRAAGVGVARPLDE